MQGCTEAFFRMTCPDDDILQVYDVRFSEVEPGHPCAQRKPENAIVPKEMTEVKYQLTLCLISGEMAMK